MRTKKKNPGTKEQEEAWENVVMRRIAQEEPEGLLSGRELHVALAHIQASAQSKTPGKRHGV